MKSLPLFVTVVLSGISSVAAQWEPFATCVLRCAMNGMMTTHYQNCTEQDLYHCFCKVRPLSEGFKQCVCETCSPEELPIESLEFGLEVCESIGAPITDIPATCDDVL